MLIVIVGVLGLCAGSFVNALVWRAYIQSRGKKYRDPKYSISKGRSMCTSCGHTLSQKDLIPVLSWMSLGGKCRYCKASISWQYPIVEIATGLLFVCSFIFWPENILGAQYIAFVAWLAIVTGLMALLVYDFKWMLLPNRILYPIYIPALVLTGTDMMHETHNFNFLALLSSVAIGGGIFYLLFQVSKGKWIGAGDIRLGFLLGLIVGSPERAVLLLFIASLLGSVGAFVLMARGKAKRDTKVPFGPFLIAASIIVYLFGSEIWQLYLDITFQGYS